MADSKKWTDEEDAMLRDLAREGLSSRAIGEKVGRTRNSVVSRANRIGIDLMAPRATHPPPDGCWVVGHDGEAIAYSSKSRSQVISSARAYLNASRGDEPFWTQEEVASMCVWSDYPLDEWRFA